MIQIERVSDGWVNERQRANLPESFAVADPIGLCFLLLLSSEEKLLNTTNWNVQ